MLKQIGSSCLVAALLALTTGCVCTHSGMAPAGIAPGAVGCGNCGVATCGGCGDYGAAPCGQGPIARGLRSLFTCNSGCGEVYYGEWYNDPPACGDPCDSCGNFTGGGGCGSCGNGWWSPLAGLANLWGYRYAPMSAGGCCGESYGGPMMMGETYGTPMMMDGMEIIPESTVTPADKVPSVIPKSPKPVKAPQATGRHARPRFTTAGTHRTLRR